MIADINEMKSLLFFTLIKELQTLSIVSSFTKTTLVLGSSSAIAMEPKLTLQ